LRNVNRYIFLGLIGAAIFVIFNCAGYLLISLMVSNSVASQSWTPPDAEAPEGAVVSFSTPTPGVLVDAPGTPVPLLPTVTAAPATPTSQPTATVTATRLPKPTPATAAPGQLEIVSHKSYVDSLGWYHIVGEVVNNGSTPMEYVEVVAKLHNADNDVIGTKLTFTAPDVIFPGAKAPFDIIALRQSQWSQIETYVLQVKGDVSAGQEQQNLLLLSQNSRLDNGLMIVSGEVQNAGDSPILAKLIVTLYDAEQNVINTSWSYADSGIIAADETAGFEIKVKHDTDPDNFHYRIQIEEEAIEPK
jgi:hypothetical protein